MSISSSVSESGRQLVHGVERVLAGRSPVSILFGLCGCWIG
jgi:hypothetical protein